VFQSVLSPLPSKYTRHYRVAIGGLSCRSLSRCTCQYRVTIGDIFCRSLSKFTHQYKAAIEGVFCRSVSKYTHQDGVGIGKRNVSFTFQDHISIPLAVESILLTRDLGNSDCNSTTIIFCELRQLLSGCYEPILLHIYSSKPHEYLQRSIVHISTVSPHCYRASNCGFPFHAIFRIAKY
jgi:hypothetical protein